MTTCKNITLVSHKKVSWHNWKWNITIWDWYHYNEISFYKLLFWLIVITTYFLWLDCCLFENKLWSYWPTSMHRWPRRGCQVEPSFLSKSKLQQDKPSKQQWEIRENPNCQEPRGAREAKPRCRELVQARGFKGAYNDLHPKGAKMNQDVGGGAEEPK